MTMPNLKCTVDTCRFWGKGNHCRAEGIEVNNQSGKAHSSSGTVCKTFIP